MVRLMKWAFDTTMQAVEFVNAGGIITNEDEIIECINTCNQEKALEILDDYNIKVFEYESRGVDSVS
jgi:hypothetical protein